jgi:hypothetical protein
MMRDKLAIHSWLFFASKGIVCRTAKPVNWERPSEKVPLNDNVVSAGLIELRGGIDVAEGWTS